MGKETQAGANAAAGASSSASDLGQTTGLDVAKAREVVSHDSGSLEANQESLKSREAYAIARDGAPLYYTVSGSGPAVLLSDGIGCAGYVYKYLKRELGSDRTVVHWHYPGHGRTPVPRDRSRVAMADLADGAACVLDAAKVERAVLIGHSMGVQVCLETFRRHRERVSGLVLMCGAFGHPLRTFKGRRTLESVLPYAAFAVNRAGIGDIIGSLWRNVLPTKLAYTLAARMEINPDLIRFDDFFPYLEHIATVDVPLFVDMLAHAGRHSAGEILATVDVPTLIVAGERDGFTPMSLSEEMHAKIAGSELLVVEQGSHTAPLERPQLVNERIIRFLDGVAERESSKQRT